MTQIFHLITTISRGGAENQLLVLVEEQISQGFKVHVVFLKGAPELLEEFEALGAQVSTELADAYFMRQPFLFRKMVSRKNAIVHAHLPRAELVALLTPAWFVLIASRHNAEPFFPGAPKLVSRWLSKVASLRCRKVIAISEAVKEFLTIGREILNPRKIHVVHYGYKQKISPENRRKELKASLWRFGSISRLTKQKDIPTMLHALEIVRREIPDVTLSLVGSGILEPDLKLEVSQLGLEDAVQFLGRTDKIMEYLHQLDVFLLTSKYEGFGLVLLEAMDAGIPIVASRNSAIPEVLGVDFPGLCETSNDRDFAAKILKLRIPEYRSQVLQFQEKRLALFDASSMAKKVIQIYLN